jgi:proline racemase
MLIGKTLQIIDSHTAGMPTRIITSGVPPLRGDTMVEKAIYFSEHYDHLRTAVFQEPRGLMRGVGALIAEPCRPEADLGLFFMDSTYKWIPMCGHGSIGVITAALDFGLVPVKGKTTTVVLDTPAGLVTGSAEITDGAVTAVSIQNVASFVFSRTELEVFGLGTVPVTVAFGGNFYAIVDSESLGISVAPANLKRLCDLATLIKQAANDQIPVKHPNKPINTIDAVRFCNKTSNDGTRVRNVVIFAEGEKGIDRSPCGTGTSAHLAALYETKRVSLGQETIHESIIGTTFRARAVSETNINGWPAIIPEITATAYTMGINTVVLSPNDPMKHGFLIA